MEKVTKQYFCDLCLSEVSTANDLVNLRLSGYGLAASSRDICWKCLQRFLDWRDSERKQAEAMGKVEVE